MEKFYSDITMLSQKGAYAEEFFAWSTLFNVQY